MGFNSGFKELSKPNRSWFQNSDAGELPRRKLPRTKHTTNPTVIWIWKVNLKVKQSHYRPGQALRIPGGWGSQTSWQSALEGGKVGSPTHRWSLPQEIFLLLISLRCWVDPRSIVRPEGLCQWKIPMTLSGIEPATFRLVAQFLWIWNHILFYFLFLY